MRGQENRQDVSHDQSAADSLLHSRAFPGLRLLVAPLLADDTAKVLAVLAEREKPQASVES